MSDRSVELGDMSPEEFRTFGHQAVDWVADYLAGVGDFPVLARTEPGAIRRRLPATPPRSGEPMQAILADFQSTVVPGITH